MRKPEHLRFNLRRVDLQVSILTATVAVISATIIFISCYYFTYNDMIYTLTERVNSIYGYFDHEFDETTFKNINSPDDMNKQSYQNMKEMFENVKQITGVQYIYTAKRNNNNQLVYVIDGMDSRAKDFRHPGDPIESEITDQLNLALEGKKVLPKDIVHADWGDIFIAYLPIHGYQDNVVGAIGIEFPADHQYSTYHMLQKTTPIVVLITCIMSASFAVMFFRRISNPHYQDLANTDSLTQLKNRNAYELDIKNACALHTAKGSSLILVDLNGLKLTNDTLGHETGDNYIKSMANALRDARIHNEVSYRIGGDEFAILLSSGDPNQAEQFGKRLTTAFEKYKNEDIKHASFAIGWGVCLENSMAAIDEAYHNADVMMYDNKKKYYTNAINNRI